MKEYELAVRIAGKVDKTFNQSLKNTESDLKKVVAKYDSAFTKLDSGYDKIIGIGSTAFKTAAALATAAAAAVTAVGVAAVNAGIEFESAFAGVRKTVDATEEEFAALRQDILDMSTEIPSTAVDIAGVMETAGQLGIATENLTDFTEVMVNLGVSTNMTASEAATALAKFANITGMDATSYENLGSVIVDLGNNFATTELDIVEMATRLAATGELAGLSEAQIMALATAMSSVGIEAESGGSTMSKLLKKIQIAVETESDLLEDYASVANMTTEEFSTAFEKDAVVALSAFIDGLNDTERNGASAIVMLDEMGLTEIRLSNTILSLANSHGVMSNAIDTANKAWDENNALAEEASRRYETTESKLSMLKNAVTVLGIEAFDEIEEPLKEGIDWLTDAVIDFTEFATGPNGISKWANDLKTELPIVIKNAKTFGTEVLEFTEPLLDAGKWLVKNPEFLADVFVATGTALATYKVSSTVSHLVSGVMTLASNPVMLGIVGVMAAVGGIAAAAYKVNQEFDELVDLRIEKSFGDIALSLEDISEVADYLVEDGSLVALREALSEFDELADIQTIINDAAADLKKANWKVSIGMALTAEEQAEYQQNIDEFVKGCNDYVVQQNYAVNLALGVLSFDGLGENDILTKVNQFYEDQYTEMQSLGTDLASAVNTAFADEILSPQEITEIADLQAKMAEIQNKLADAEFEANLISLGKEYDFTNLDSDSFQALQSELTTRLEEATAQYAEARDQLLANAVLMKNEGYFESDADFETYVDEIWANYLGKVSGKQSEIADYLFGAIDQSVIESGYADILAATREVVAGELGTDDVDSWLRNPSMKVTDVLTGMPVDDIRAVSGATGELLGNMQGIIDLLRESESYYKENGLAVPEWLKNSIATADSYTALTNVNGMTYAALGQVIQGNPVASSVFDSVKDEAYEKGKYGGGFFFDGVIAGMDADSNLAAQRMSQIYQGVLAQAAADAMEKQSLSYGMFYPTSNKLGINKFSDPLGLLKNMPGHADGGIFTRPHIAAFAEKGPEAAIPLDGSRNAISLWESVGRLLGMGSVLDDVEIGGSSGAPHIEYKPQLVFNGGTPNQSDIESALRNSQEEFDVLMRQWLKNNSRYAF